MLGFWALEMPYGSDLVRTRSLVVGTLNGSDLACPRLRAIGQLVLHWALQRLHRTLTSWPVRGAFSVCLWHSQKFPPRARRIVDRDLWRSKFDLALWRRKVDCDLWRSEFNVRHKVLHYDVLAVCWVFLGFMSPTMDIRTWAWPKVIGKCKMLRWLRHELRYFRETSRDL